MVSLLKEQENFLRNAILTVDHSKEVLQCFLEQHLKNNHQTFEDFLNKNQHDIYHLYYDSKCCQCGPGPLQRKKRILFASQMELLFDKNKQLSIHKITRRSDFCCCYAKQNVTTAVLDLTLARCLLMHCCIDMFWYGCLDFKGVTLEQFLNSNKHMLYHLWKNNAKCCKCQPDFIFPCNAPLIMESEWKKIFSSTLPPCENDRKRPVNGAISICAFSATPSITVQQIHLELQGIIIQYCCSTQKSVEKLAELRNVTFGHVKKASMSCTEFNTFMSEAEHAILDLATVCGKEDYYKQMLLDLRDKPLDTRMFCQYEKVLLQTISNYEDIIKENEVLKDGMESLKNSNAKMKENIERLCILQTEGSQRQRLIGETSAEIDNHRKDQTYTEIKAVTACLQMLDNSKVLILSGREGSGKSRNSLEILRRMKEKHPEIDVIKLKRLTQFSDIIEKNAMTLVLFEDAFGRITKQFCENTDEPILDSLYSNINLGNVKVIFVMRNTVKQECQRLLSSHEIFCNNIAYLDLNSKEFGLSVKEKERIFINYCTTNDINIICKKKPSYCDNYGITNDKIKVSIIDEWDVSCRFSAENKLIVFNSLVVEAIIISDPYQGFPQCCRIFTQNKKNTILGAPFFKYPSNSLLKEIDNMRMEGIDNDVKGLKYIILVYLLLNQAPSAMSINYDDHAMLSISENNIDVQAHQKLFSECYNKTFGLKLPDIIYLYEELACRYLIRKEQKICFQHRAVQDSVLISYFKVNPTAIIPLLSIDYMLDIVRSQNYMEQDAEIVIKIPKPYYPELAVNIISSFMSSNRYDKFMESKVITDTDEDLIYQLIVCINNFNDTISCRLSLRPNTVYTHHYFPLYLLRNIGKLDKKMLTVNHTKDQMLITVSIADQYISLCVDPNLSLLSAFQSKYVDIAEWLLKNTDHSLLDFGKICSEIMFDRFPEYIKLLLENVKHSMINMTQLCIGVCSCKRSPLEEIKHALDWIVNNVDNSLMNYYHIIINIRDRIDIVIHIIQKVNHRWLNTIELVKQCCKFGESEIVEWAFKNSDQEIFDEAELINITIQGYRISEFIYRKYFYVGDIFIGFSKILERLILKKPGILKCCDIYELVEVANRNKWYGVLELLFKHDNNFSIDTDKIIEDIYKHWHREEDESKIYHYDYAYCRKIVQLLMKYYSNYVNVNKIFEKACHFGIHCIVEELSLVKLDNISNSFDITLDKLRDQEFNEYDICLKTGHGKILMLLLPRINYNIIDLNSLMNVVCFIGHSAAIQWLLENKASYRFDMRNVMNKACSHGDVYLVRYLYRKYSNAEFDSKTAMINACGNTYWKVFNVCEWLWMFRKYDVFDMNAALHNASRLGNYKVVEWMLASVDKGLYDIKYAVFCACEHGNRDTLHLLLDQSSINTLDIQSAFTIACRNENNGLSITKLLYERADKSTIDINTVFSVACKNYRIDIVQWIIETFDQDITFTKTGDEYNNYIKNRVNKDQAITCILDMYAPDQKKEHINETKKQLLMQILKKLHPKMIHIYKLLEETCKKDWFEIFKWILGSVDHACLNIGEVINTACRDRAFNIVKWSLENIDIQLLDADNVTVESCGLGWVECLVLIKKHCHHYVFDVQASMVEACNYDRPHVAKWLLQNFNYQLFDLPLLLQAATRNGWQDIFLWLVTHFQFNIFEMQTAFGTACHNRQEYIVELLLQKDKGQMLCTTVEMINAFNTGAYGVAALLLKNFEPDRNVINHVLIEACRHGKIEGVYLILSVVEHSLLDVETALYEACNNHMHETLVLVILDHINQKEVDLKTVKKHAIRHKWRNVQLAIPERDIEDLNQIEQETGTDCIVIS